MRTLLLLALALPLRAAAPTPFTPPAAFRAEIADTDHIDLHWQPRAGEPGGCFVEFRLGDETEFSLLAMAWTDATTFRHPDVARATRFTYRLVPFFGASSATAEIATGAEPAAGTFSREVDGPLPPLRAEATSPPARSLRVPATLPDASPAQLTATRPSPTTVDLRWEDRAADEDGYLVEISSADAPGWQVCALLPADARSFRKTRLPPNLTCRFRVRAFFRGSPSEQASVVTPEAFRPAGPAAKFSSGS
jgi:hypothetical protein